MAITWEKITGVLSASGYHRVDLFQVVAAAYITRKWENEPLWVLAIAPPGSGKTCTVTMFREAPDVVTVSALTPAGLMSGWGGDQCDRSLLNELQSGQLLVAKDFGTVLSMGWQASNEIFGYLREAFDGYVQKTFGNCHREYRPKFNFVAAATEASDMSRSLSSQLGERFLRFKVRSPVLPIPPPKIVENTYGYIGDWLRELEKGSPHELTITEHRWISDLATAVAKLRTEVIRDGKSREISEVPGFEGTARLQIQFGKLYAGLMMVTGDKKDTQTILRHTARSSVKPTMYRITEMIRSKPYKYSAIEIADELRCGYQVVRRILESMYAFRLVERRKENVYPKKHHWSLTKEFYKETAVMFDDVLVPTKRVVPMKKKTVRRSKPK